MEFSFRLPWVKLIRLTAEDLRSKEFSFLKFESFLAKQPRLIPGVLKHAHVSARSDMYQEYSQELLLLLWQEFEKTDVSEQKVEAFAKKMFRFLLWRTVDMQRKTAKYQARHQLMEKEELISCLGSAAAAESSFDFSKFCELLDEKEHALMLRLLHFPEATLAEHAACFGCSISKISRMRKNLAKKLRAAFSA